MVMLTGNLTYVSEYGNPPISPDPWTEVNEVTESTLLVLEEEGMIFDGWYYTPTFDEGTKAEVGDVPGTAHLTLYAKWVFPTVYDRMTSIADEIRVLSGGTEKIGLAEMAEDLGEANAEVDTQADVIEQIAAALEGKALEPSVKLESCVVTLKLDGSKVTYQQVVGGQVSAATITVSDATVDLNVQKNSIISIHRTTSATSNFGTTGGIEAVDFVDYSYFTYFVTDTGTIQIQAGGSGAPELT